jgi:hypothetical protein
MDKTVRAIHEWTESVYSQGPIDSSIWTEEGDCVQVLLKLSNMVIIADLIDSGEGLECGSKLEVNLESWQPGSIQTRRMADGMVRFRHRSKEIFLAARVRAPEWASALLEQWLISMQGDIAKPKDKNRRISDLNRSRDLIKKMLEQADLSLVQEGIDLANIRLQSADDRLSGRRV